MGIFAIQVSEEDAKEHRTNRLLDVDSDNGLRRGLLCNGR